MMRHHRFKRSRSREIRGVFRAGAGLLLLTSCSQGVLDPKGPIARANVTILYDSLVIMLAIIVPTIIATLAFAWWFRASNTRARYMPEWAYSGRIELVTWAVPLLTIILLGGVTWIGSHELDPARPIASKKPPLEVQVVSLDWKWLFLYPGQHIAALNQLVIPVGVPVHFTLTSASVLNTFFVPQLGSMIYTMNGMADQLNLQADEPGIYPGISGHFSGDGFADMHFDVRAVPEKDFASWVSATKGGGGVLDNAQYALLARQSVADKPRLFGQADSSLFQNIVAQRIAPGSGPPQTVATLQSKHKKTEH